MPAFLEIQTRRKPSSKWRPANIESLRIDLSGSDQPANTRVVIKDSLPHEFQIIRNAAGALIPSRKLQVQTSPDQPVVIMDGKECSQDGGFKIPINQLFRLIVTPITLEEATSLEVLINFS